MTQYEEIHCLIHLINRSEEENHTIIIIEFANLLHCLILVLYKITQGKGIGGYFLKNINVCQI